MTGAGRQQFVFRTRSCGTAKEPRRMRSQAPRMLLAALLGLSACGDSADLPVSAGTGPDPQLPSPTRTLFPTVKVAPVKGWPAGGKPDAAPRLAVTRFAEGLAHPL